MYIGCHFKKFGGYNTGGSGYLLSQTSFKKLINYGFNGPNNCTIVEKEEEDVQMGSCMRVLQFFILY